MDDAIFITKYLFKNAKYNNKKIINDLRIDFTKKNIIIPKFFYIEIETTLDSTIIKYNIIYSGIINKMIKDLPEFRNNLKNKWKAKSSQDGIITKCFTLNNNGVLKFEVFHPQNMCETRWYQKLNDSIKTHINICKKQDYFSSLAILVNGRPGLGKTKFIDYIARKKICNSVSRIDMTRVTTQPFCEIIKKYRTEGSIFSTNNNANILLIDELDKYVDMYVKNSYQKLITHKKKDEEAMSFEYYLKNQKEEILYEILKLIDSENHYHKNIFIFCANNFDTLFNDINNTHFHSLKKRFLSFEFEMCDKSEIANYINHMSNYIDLKLNDGILDKIPDIKIPYRDLAQLFFVSQYNLGIFIEELKKFELDSEGRTDCLKYKYIKSKRSLLKDVFDILDECTGEFDCSYLLANKLILSDEVLDILDNTDNEQYNKYIHTDSRVVHPILMNPNLNDAIFEKLFQKFEASIIIILKSYQDCVKYLNNINLNLLKKYNIEKYALHHSSLSFSEVELLIKRDNYVYQSAIQLVNSGIYSFEECLDFGLNETFCLKNHLNAPKSKDVYNDNLDYSEEELEELVLVKECFYAAHNKKLNFHKIYESFDKFEINSISKLFIIKNIIINENFDLEIHRDFINKYSDHIKSIIEKSDITSDITFDNGLISKRFPEFWYKSKIVNLELLNIKKDEITQAILYHIFPNLTY